MGEETTTQIRQEGQPAFPSDTENDNSADSSPEETNDDQTQSQEGESNSGENKDGGDNKRGFADDPRWQQREGDWKKRFNEQEERHTGEIAKLREEFQQQLDKLTKGDSGAPMDIPTWFGGGEKEWREFLAWNATMTKQAEKQAEENAYKRLTGEQAEEQKRIDEATEYFNKEVIDIEQDPVLNPQGEKIDRNKLLKFALDNDLVDSKGRWNYRAAFKMMKPQEVFRAKEALKDRKQIAGATTSEHRAETKPTDVATSETFKKPGARPW